MIAEPIETRDIAAGWYCDKDPGTCVHVPVLDFILERAGKRILDLGCGIGGYVLALRETGRACIEADVNPAYVACAVRAGCEAHVVGPELPFQDGEFDTVLLIDVLEHVRDVRPLLAEARRVTSRNVLVTVPDCGANADLARAWAFLEHMCVSDHVQFFDALSLERILREHFPRVAVERREPRDTYLYAALFPWLLRKALSLCFRLRLWRPRVCFRLYAEARAQE